jgi:hypothetical protein
MEINLNPRTGLNDRIAPVDFTGGQAVSAALVKQEDAGGLRGPSLVVTERPVTGLEALESDAELDLRRDDRLGSLVMSAFDLKPPEAPEFI